MNATDYKVCIRVLNQTARVTERVHAYEYVIFACVTRVSDACHTRLALNLSPVCTVPAVSLLVTSQSKRQYFFDITTRDTHLYDYGQWVDMRCECMS